MKYYGKEKCRILKEIRAEIAKANDIEWVVSECKHQGNCKGTCPKCEQEVRQLEAALAKREALGKTVAVVGISASIALSVTGCINPFQATAGTPEPPPPGGMLPPEISAETCVSIPGEPELPPETEIAVDGEMLPLETAETEALPDESVVEGEFMDDGMEDDDLPMAGAVVIWPDESEDETETSEETSESEIEDIMGEPAV